MEWSSERWRPCISIMRSQCTLDPAARVVLHGPWTRWVTPCTHGPAVAAPLPALHAAERKWCMWHQDCCKADFCVLKQIDVLYDDCWFDREDHYEFDLLETPVVHCVLDHVHTNKNSLRGILRQLYKYKEGMDDHIAAFCADLQAR